jgi:uncharacterized BrkB/YihY/UPF0761 family membrane protein
VPRFQIAGALLATFLWLLATFAFSLYLEFADPGSAYGVLGGLLVLLLFLYITSIVIILGAELNAAIVQRRRGHVGATDREAHPIAMFDHVIDNRQERNTPRLIAWGMVAALFVVGLLGGKRSSDERSDIVNPPIE